MFGGSGGALVNIFIEQMNALCSSIVLALGKIMKWEKFILWPSLPVCVFYIIYTV